MNIAKLMMLWLLVSQLVQAEEYKEILFSVPDGTRRVKLEVREDASQPWKALRMIHMQGRSSEVRMKLPVEYLYNFQIRFSKKDSVNYQLLKEKNIHKNLSNSKVYGGVGTGVDVMATPTTSSFTVEADSSDRSSDSEANTTEVVESDIWKVEGEILYFFNQYRGLQIFNIQDPRNPVFLAFLRMPALGEQMYVLDEQNVLLLLRESRYPEGLAPGETEDGSRSEIVVVNWQQGEASVASKTVLPGQLLESRLVGRRLFTVSNVNYPYWWWSPGRFWWNDDVLIEESGLADDPDTFSPSYLTTLDLTFPNEPVVVEERGLDSRARVVSAGTTHLLVVRDAGDSWSKDVVDVFSINATGTPTSVGTVNCGGWINDKFKMRVQDNVLTVVSQAYQAPENLWWRRFTLIENFNLSNDASTSPKLMDSIHLADNETLHATRFDSDKLYVVTFRQIDPLFVVDLSDPDNLVVNGELEIPGWSTYLITRGDRLISVGREGRRVAVSLFDVSDPSAPEMLSRIYLGDEHDFTYSEANWDEKAVGYLPEQDLILIPYQTWGESVVQSVQINGDTLEKTGQVSHEVRARRATMVDGYLVSISGEKLIISELEGEEQDNAVITEFPLSWPVDKVHVVNDNYLLEEQNSYRYWGTSPRPAILRLVNQLKPDEELAVVQLPEGHLVDSRWIPESNQWFGLLEHYPSESSDEKGYYDYYAWYRFDSVSIVQVKVKPEGALEMIQSAVIKPEGDSHQFYDSGFFHASEAWLGLWVSDQSTNVEPNQGITENQLNLRFIAMSLSQGDEFEILSDISRQQSIVTNYHWYYPTSYPPVFAESRWLYSAQYSGEWTIMEVFDYLDPTTPALIADPDLPKGLYPVSAYNATEDGATLLLQGTYSHGGTYSLYYDSLTIADWYYPPNYHLAYFDGAGLFLLENTFSDFPSSRIKWTDDSFYIQEQNYYYYPFLYEDTIHPVRQEPKPIVRYRLGPDWELEEIGKWTFQGENAQDFRVQGNHLFLQNGNFLQWINIDEVGAEPDWSVLPGGVRYSMSLHNAAYDEGKGFWYPVGQFGVEFVPGPSHSGNNSKSVKSFSVAKASSSTWELISSEYIEILDKGLGGGPKIPEGEDYAFLESSVFLEVDQVGDTFWHQVGEIGYCYIEHYPWVYHQTLGWLYVYGDNASLDGFWFWRLHNGLGWLWTSALKYPWCYNALTESWWHFSPSADGQVFRYDAATQQWILD